MNQAVITIPRSTGEAGVHRVPEEVVKCRDLGSVFPDELEAGLKYLQSINADLRCGDLVLYESEAGYRNSGLAIYEGEQIINLSDYPDDYGTLPSQFRVITNGTPINYWHKGEVQIVHNRYVWFDLEPVRDQCLNNIKYDLVGDKWMIFTTFEYDGRSYRIIFDYYNDYDNEFDPDTYMFEDPMIADQACEHFRKLLSNPKLNPFSLYSLELEYKEDGFLYMSDF